ncbi:ABC transporter ATP-binding protein [Capnocytophaga felis]|uniref:ABC transporter ATP-binding protein n=1 Tax=Capnocytophaga felis TaxID=2267611 RepID=A0A5M4BAP2_9FLAO|nr:ATP-binding cassette domain-containing protein [Capnocytophaga felis]GET46658.1 ABC transporter ATP-binding protein [Capnocytophaga felis]GET48760.1 ABC transporter ATP-binding protein [Capnocytophaga felis]
MITVKNLDFSFRKKNIFKDLNLDIEPGQICGLFGKNGVGKTTFLYNLAGLLFPNQGTIQVLGFAPKERKTDFLREIFVIPDEVYLPDTSVEKYQKRLSCFYPKFSLEQFRNFLRAFEVSEEEKLHNLSYGQRKKVLISFALAANTSVVLMDEPTNGLDISGKTQFRKIMAEIMNDERCFIISTHQTKDLENLIDRVIVLDEKKVLFNQSMQEISQFLEFKASHDKTQREEAFYLEESFFGDMLVLPNNSHNESKIDLELLYKAVISNPKKVNDWFNSKNK